MGDYRIRRNCIFIKSDEAFDGVLKGFTELFYRKLSDEHPYYRVRVADRKLRPLRRSERYRFLI